MMCDNLMAHLVDVVQEGRPVVFVASHPLYLERRRWELLQETGGYVNVRWFLWSQWVESLLQVQGQSFVRITHSVREEIVESLLPILQQEGRIPQLAAGLHHSGMNRSIALWIEDLTKDENEKWLERFRSAEDDVLNELADVASAYLAWTGSPSTPFKETMQMERMACDAILGHESHWPNAQETVFFFEGELGRTPWERQLLQSLQTTGRTIVTHIEPSTVSLTVPKLPTRWFVLPSAMDEVRAAVRDVEHVLPHLESLSDLAVVVPNEEYRRLMIREFAACGHSVQNTKQGLLVHRDLVQKLLALFQLPLSNWSRKDLLAAVERFASERGVEELALVWGRELIRQSGVQEGAEAWRRLFLAQGGRARRRLGFLMEQATSESAQEQENIRERLAFLAQWLRLFSRFRRWLEQIPLQGTWSEYLQATRSLLASFAAKEDLVGQSLLQLLRVREEIAQSLAAGNVTISWKRYVGWFLNRIRLTGVDAISDHVSEDSIRVFLPEEVCGGRFAHLFVLGLAEEVLPAVYAPHWIWARCGVADREVHDRHERQRLQAVLNVATQNLYLYTPQQAGRQQPVVPNRAISAQLAEAENRSVQLGRGAFARREPANRQSRDPVEAPTVPFYQDEHTLHVTGIDLYRRCAFRFFADRVLQVRSRMERADGLTALDFGSIMHAVLKKWLEFRNEDSEQAQELVERLLALELDEYESRWQLSGAFWRSQKERMRKSLLQFLVFEADQLNRPGQKSFGEWGFGIVHREKMAANSTTEPLLLRQGEQAIRLCGVIDRVDVGPDSFSVHDYKLTRCPSTKEMEEAADLQVALYLLAYHHLNGEVPPLRGRYALLRDPGGGHEIAFGEGASSFQNWSRQVEQQVFSLVERMKSGDVTPNPWKRDECDRCSYQTVCRHAVRQEERGVIQ